MNGEELAHLTGLFEGQKEFFAFRFDSLDKDIIEIKGNLQAHLDGHEKWRTILFKDILPRCVKWVFVCGIVAGAIWLLWRSSPDILNYPYDYLMGVD
jgi:hypothetical protein